MPERFVSTMITPIAEAGFLCHTAVGEPGLPKRFRWGKRELVLRELVEQWKETGPCSSGGGEKYLRKHWFRVLTEEGQELKLYFDRQARSSRARKARWCLYTIVEDE